MTLQDHETGEDIINPYITLYSPENKGVALNTHSFRDIQRELINIHDEAVYARLQFNEKKQSRYQMVGAKQSKQLNKRNARTSKKRRMLYDNVRMRIRKPKNIGLLQ